MTKQPEALRLADWLQANYEADEIDEGAAELRRLYEVNQELLEALKKIANIELQMYGPDWEEIEEAHDIANAAIAKAGEQP